jgi:hypothetical protein
VDENVASAARAAAKRLAGVFKLPLDTEVELALDNEGPRSRGQYFDPISLGSLIVAVATLAWTIYADMKGKGTVPKPDHIARRVQLQVRVPHGVSPDHANTVIEVVVDEVLNVSGMSGRDDG